MNNNTLHLSPYHLCHSSVLIVIYTFEQFGLKYLKNVNMDSKTAALKI